MNITKMRIFNKRTYKIINFKKTQYERKPSENKNKMI